MKSLLKMSVADNAYVFLPITNNILINSNEHLVFVKENDRYVQKKLNGTIYTNKLFSEDAIVGYIKRVILTDSYTSDIEITKKYNYIDIDGKARSPTYNVTITPAIGKTEANILIKSDNVIPSTMMQAQFTINKGLPDEFNEQYTVYVNDFAIHIDPINKKLSLIFVDQRFGIYHTEESKTCYKRLIVPKISNIPTFVNHKLINNNNSVLDMTFCDQFTKYKYYNEAKYQQKIIQTPEIYTLSNEFVPLLSNVSRPYSETSIIHTNESVTVGSTSLADLSMVTIDNTKVNNVSKAALKDAAIPTESVSLESRESTINMLLEFS